MRRCRVILLAGAFLAVAGLPLRAQYATTYLDLYDSETVSALKSHVAGVASPALEGRAPGSEGERAAAAYVTRILEGYGVDVVSGPDGELFGIRRPEGDTLTSRNVVGFVQGCDPELRERYIVIGARLDNLGTSVLVRDGEPETKVFAGANGNASGLAMLLELSRLVATHSVALRRSVVFVAFGSSTIGHAGSWYFLNRSFAGSAASIDAMVCLDMLGTGYAGFYGYTSANVDMNGIAASLKGTLQPVFPEIVPDEPYPSDHRSFYAARIPSILFTTGPYPEYNTWNDLPSILDYEWMERELEYIYSYTMALQEGPKPLFRTSEDAARKPREPGTVSYFDCDARPTFLGSASPETFMKKWVYQYLRYPPDAVSEGVQGNVVVDFIIDEKGKVTDVKVLRGVDERLSAEAVRVISASPAWKPGRKGGKKVRTELSVTVEFRLERKKR